MPVTAVNGQGAPVPVGADVAVLLCSDVVERRRSPLSAEMIGATLSSRAVGLTVMVVPSLCAWASELPETLQSLAAKRVVVGCSEGGTKRQRILAALRASGVHPAGAHVVNLAAGERADPRHVAEQAVARLRSALARVACADLGVPVCEGAAPLSSVSVTRRGLFSFGYLARRPVASWNSGRCGGHGASRPCVQACPHNAVSVAGSLICVDAASCTGCGACVGACRTGAMSLNGTSIAELEAAARTLVEEAYRLRLGIAVMCSESTFEAPLGGRWLALEVPSLEMVSVGWLLQIVAAQVPATIVGCTDAACADRARQLARLTATMIDQVAPSRRPLVVDAGERLPVHVRAEVRRTASRDDRSTLPIGLPEPEATVKALALLSSMDGASAIQPPSVPSGPGDPEPLTEFRRRPWRLASPLVPLGEVAIDPTLCSGCGCCAAACPSGALSATWGEALALTFDASGCNACGNCVPSCPEGALSLCRIIDSSSLAAGRRTVAEIVTHHRCRSCGKPNAVDLVKRAVVARLGVSHPEIASRLRGDDRCADCTRSLR